MLVWRTSAHQATTAACPDGTGRQQLGDNWFSRWVMVFKEFEVNDPFCHNHSKASHQSLIKLDRDDTVLVPNSSLQLMMLLHHMSTYRNRVACMYSGFLCRRRRTKQRAAKLADEAVRLAEFGQISKLVCLQCFYSTGPLPPSHSYLWLIWIKNHNSPFMRP